MIIAKVIFGISIGVESGIAKWTKEALVLCGKEQTMSRWIDAEWLSELFPDTGEGNWTYNATAQGYINSAPTLPKSEAYRIVFEDLTSIDGLFTGRYDHKHGKEAFMYGISTVMESIAAHVSDECYEAFQKRFFDNVIKSEERANAKQCVQHVESVEKE